ncbi:C-5 sterol desaturase B-like protein [Basidiobolus meristosporus CBS 931.73]|uniref:C-5 sterol desaturase B-like protein n=1 Tax=Basidiobolus meristosporus CBS 931.73 TaxID=1314790 RepID=A0A1Y1Y720_9FUNG|nr:C-5 sterol desaturase B-like protein [Basidiobolus meristosporus CBS 931.73]|eukprot:ORX93526.1 C-5 sterol desaturase B-like protein [Basidiobolus meristosporus CBS 931.73]
MDIILWVADEYIFDKAYSAFAYAGLPDVPRDAILRQFTSLILISAVGAYSLYMIFSTISFHLFFDKRQMNHPRFLKDQINLEIKMATDAIPLMALLTAPFFLLEVRGYSQLYESVDEYGWGYLVSSIFMFLFITDFGIYWIHRGLHHKSVYARLHKPHHKWIVPTPFASIAFHPIDGWAQSLPYHICVFLFPMHKILYLALFTFVQIWSILIHDGEYFTHDPVINSAAHHTVHHLYFNYNYGQYFTLWDRIGGSYRKPSDEIYNTELRSTKSVYTKQAKEVDDMVTTLETKSKTK